MTTGDLERDFEAWAKVSADLRGRTEAERATILAHLELAGSWSGVEHRWALALLDDLARGDLERAMRYSEICSEAERRRATADPYALVAARARETPLSHAATVAGSPQAHTEPTPPRHAPAGAYPPVPFQSQRSRAGTEALPAMAAAAPSPPPRQDFRHDAVYGEAPVRTAVPSASADFVSDLTPAGQRPQAPSVNQSETMPLEEGHMAALMRVTTDALGWPVERYAAFIAELEARPADVSSTCQRYGVDARFLDAVRRGWDKRLAKNHELASRYLHAMAQFRHGR